MNHLITSQLPAQHLLCFQDVLWPTAAFAVSDHPISLVFAEPAPACKVTMCFPAIVGVVVILAAEVANRLRVLLLSHKHHVTVGACSDNSFTVWHQKIPL